MTETKGKDRRIITLMGAAQEERDLAWLQQALRVASELELSTLPPYLCAYWSIKDPYGSAGQLIYSVLVEEMLHMGLACNMLTSIGGTPQINTLIPTYPGPLPGGVRPQLEVSLCGLSPEVIDVFLQIEYPEEGPITLFRGETYPTIGAFYDAILKTFKDLDPPFSGDHQVTWEVNGNEWLFAIKSRPDAERAIQLIKDQGEGTSKSPTSGDELAHYYKFEEIKKGKTLVLIGDTGKWEYGDPPIDFPAVYRMGCVPAGGWPNPTAEAKPLLATFNQAYKGLLDVLQGLWTGDGTSSMSGAIYGNMAELAGPAIQLMQIPLPDGSGLFYGPEFIPSP